MSYKFGDTPWDYYEKNKANIKLPEWAKRDINEIFKALKKYRKTSKAVNDAC